MVCGRVEISLKTTDAASAQIQGAAIDRFLAKANLLPSPSTQGRKIEPLPYVD